MPKSFQQIIDDTTHEGRLSIHLRQDYFQELAYVAKRGSTIVMETACSFGSYPQRDLEIAPVGA